MIKFLFTVSFFVLPFSILWAQEDRSFQVWNKNEGVVKFSPQLQFSASDVIYYSVTNKNVAYKFGQVALKYKLSNSYMLGGAFRMAASRKAYGWQNEKRPMFFGIASKTLHSITLSHIDRIEYRFFDRESNHFRYFQKLHVDFGHFTNLNISPFISGETFIKFNNDDFHLARAYAGLNAISLRHFKMQVYYAYQKMKVNSFWLPTDAVGMNLQVSL